MGLFTQKPQEPSAWAALPGEPLDETNPTEQLADAPSLDLMDVGLSAQYSTIVFPVHAPAPEAADTSDTGEATDTTDPGDTTDTGDTGE